MSKKAAPRDPGVRSTAGMSISLREAVAIGTLLVGLTASYFKGQADSERTARLIAKEVLSENMDTVTYRLGELSDGLGHVQRKLDELRDRLVR